MILLSVTPKLSEKPCTYNHIYIGLYTINLFVSEKHLEHIVKHRRDKSYQFADNGGNTFNINVSSQKKRQKSFALCKQYESQSILLFHKV